MTLPNFLIIGAAKGGTTTLHYVIDQHPEIYMSPMKEPSFFWAYGSQVRLVGPGAEVLKHRYVDDFNQYQKLFAGVTTEKAIGESSVRYLAHPSAPASIHKFIPQAKLVLVLRQPADRAFSAFMHYLRDGMEPCSDFSEALAQDRQGLRDQWTFGRYLKEGAYCTAIKRYLEYFHRDQMHISLFEDLKDNPQDLLRTLFEFLDVDDTYKADMSHQHNVSGVISNSLLRTVWTRSNPLRALVRPLLSERLRHAAFEVVIRDLEKPDYSPELRADLTDYYREEIEGLEEILQRDLSHWLE